MGVNVDDGDVVLDGDSGGALRMGLEDALGHGGDEGTGTLRREDVFDADGDRGKALLHRKVMKYFRTIESIFRSAGFAIKMDFGVRKLVGFSWVD